MIVFETSSFEGTPRTKVYPRIGGGARFKHFGWSHEKVKVMGHCEAGDIPVFDLYTQSRSIISAVLPLEGGQTVTKRILMAEPGPTKNPMGGGFIRFTFSAYVLV